MITLNWEGKKLIENYINKRVYNIDKIEGEAGDTKIAPSD